MKHISSTLFELCEVLDCPDLISITISPEAIYGNNRIIYSSFQRNEVVGIAHVDILHDDQKLCFYETCIATIGSKDENNVALAARQAIIVCLEKMRQL